MLKDCAEEENTKITGGNTAGIDHLN